MFVVFLISLLSVNESFNLIFKAAYTFWYGNFQAQIAELQKMLESLQTVENEVQIIRRQKAALEQEMEHTAIQKQGSGGVWRWLGGGQ